MLSELALQVLQYLFDRSGRLIAISDLEVQLGRDIHDLRPAIEDLKVRGYVNEDEYRLEILPAGSHFARSRWV